MNYYIYNHLYFQVVLMLSLRVSVAPTARLHTLQQLGNTFPLDSGQEHRKI